MSTVVYRYSTSKQFKLKGVKHAIKENITDGTGSGLSFFFLKKEGEDFYKVDVKEINKDNFLVKEKKGDKETSKEISLTELKKMLKVKELAFVKDYIENLRGKYGGAKIRSSSTGGAKKSSKKSSKKVSKKSSKKVSKKVSKKPSKKSSKKLSKKSSMKPSKKPSRKSSRKSKIIM
jgi:hypothetical protein